MASGQTRGWGQTLGPPFSGLQSMKHAPTLLVGRASHSASVQGCAPAHCRQSRCSHWTQCDGGMQSDSLEQGRFSRPKVYGPDEHLEVQPRAQRVTNNGSCTRRRAICGAPPALAARSGRLVRISHRPR